MRRHGCAEASRRHSVAAPRIGRLGGVAFHAEGNLVVANGDNYRVQVLRCMTWVHLRTIGSEGAGNGQFNAAFGVAL